MNNAQSTNGEIKDTLVVAETNQGIEIHATPLRLTRYLATIEIYDPVLSLRTSEVLSDFRIVLRDKTIYSGQGVIRKAVSTAFMMICEVALNETSWMDLEFDSESLWNGKLRNDFTAFVSEWEKLYRIMPEFKVVVADMQSFLSDLRLWLEQVEINIRSQPANGREKFEPVALEKLREFVLPTLQLLFERFETAAAGIEKESGPAHSLYAKRLLHPLVLCAPFMYRTFQKPLGYAGDYEMVNMMVRNTFEGGSVYAKILNTFFLNTPPVIAHRNRIDYLYRLLVQETCQAARRNRPLRALSLGCGPAHEIQRFLRESHLADQTRFTLLDFNAETLAYVQTTLEEIKRKNQRTAEINCQKMSVQQILKQFGREAAVPPNERYDLIYCAGLFDYLNDVVCEKLVSIFCGMVAPGGMVLVTNVDPQNPSLGWMEYVVDWHLLYRNSKDLARFVPKQIPPDAVRIIAEPTGMNNFVEIRKPRNV